jgi:hypothetical protein
MKLKRTLIVGIILLIGFVWVSLFGVQENGLAQHSGNEVYLPLVLKPGGAIATPTVAFTPISPTPTVGVTPMGPTPNAVKYEDTMTTDYPSVNLYNSIPAQ